MRHGRKLHTVLGGAMVGRKLLFFVVTLIALLLLSDILFTWYNNSVITRNRLIQERGNRAIAAYEDIGRYVVQALDLGIRGFAISKKESLARPYYNAIRWRDSLVNNARVPLKELGFDLTEFEQVNDSLTKYIARCKMMKGHIDSGDLQKFEKTFDEDMGRFVWWKYMIVDDSIRAFIKSTSEKAEGAHKAALFRNQIIQIVLFLICVPTLVYTAVNTGRTLKLNALLREKDTQQTDFLQQQNALLEQKVIERTQEIASQAFELSEQKETIERQNLEIQKKNEVLESEVQSRVQEIKAANSELIKQNNQLEQFGFITAHNLRAPVARIQGLANLITISKGEDRELAIEKMVSSSYDLDRVIKDLNMILDIRRHTSSMKDINVYQTLQRILKTLEKERVATGATLTFNLDKETSVYGVPSYVESILFNLISNAIKYRALERPPIIIVTTTIKGDFTCLKVSDNGLGLDLQKFGHDLFGLYKRFHTHVEGRGIGLYLVKTQIAAMGGKIEVQSQLGEGTTFLIYLRSNSGTDES